jgi:hypothetical protein
VSVSVGKNRFADFPNSPNARRTGRRNIITFIVTKQKIFFSWEDFCCAIRFGHQSIRALVRERREAAGMADAPDIDCGDSVLRKAGEAWTRSNCVFGSSGKFCRWGRVAAVFARKLSQRGGGRGPPDLTDNLYQAGREFVASALPDIPFLNIFYHTTHYTVAAHNGSRMATVPDVSALADISFRYGAAKISAAIAPICSSALWRRHRDAQKAKMSASTGRSR